MRLEAMENRVLVQSDGVSKKFCRDLKRSLWYGLQDIARECLGGVGPRPTLRRGEFWALRDVGFELRRGSALGLVGPNGSGKTTLLRIIAGLIKPSGGTVRVRGRVAALIALGAGFNPVLTARENIYVNMSLLGLTGSRIAERYDRVVEFAEIGDAVEAPIQSYSAGMVVRLAFSCAIHTEPDVLLIDEVLSVGDAGFRAKCLDRIGDLLPRTAVILVSHQMPHIARICDSVLLLRPGGEAAHYREPAEAIRRYFAACSPHVEEQATATEYARIHEVSVSGAAGPGESAADSGRFDAGSRRPGKDSEGLGGDSGGPGVEYRGLDEVSGEPASVRSGLGADSGGFDMDVGPDGPGGPRLACGEPFTLALLMDLAQAAAPVEIRVQFLDEALQTVCVSSGRIDVPDPAAAGLERCTITARYDALPLAPGGYYLSVDIRDADSGRVLASRRHVCPFTALGAYAGGPYLNIGANWKIERSGD